MSAESSALPFRLASGGTATWRSRALAIVLMAVMGSIFWVDSRYPALVKRYRAGTQVKASGELTFGVVYQVDRTMPLTTRVWRTTVNWLDANRVGMTFSFLFGPAALTFLSMLPRRRTKSRYWNTLFGAVAGVPMAVCSNCIAPIARGLYLSGMSRESVLAAMFASPALNVVVLAMSFALFPAKLAVLKLGTVLFMILVFAPMAAERFKQDDSGYTCPIEIAAGESWPQAIVSVATRYAKSFWQVFKIAFPLMILAAALGALVIEVLPPQALTGQATLLRIVAVSLISAFLPVPMAFDVAIAYIAMTHGAPLPYVAAVLCTLGILSVYSASVVGKTISWRVAGAAYVTVAALGVVAGLVARTF